MKIVARMLKFTLGGIAGAAVGATAAILLAPESGQDLQRDLRERIRRAKIDGVEAKAAKERELIRKYRAEVNDPEALTALEQETSLERDQAAMEIAAGGAA